MKRQSDTILDQPKVKKSDGNASTDLRSKIGAKLQTLLHTSRAEALRRKKALLFGEPEQYSEIIIDPGIVVKTEPEECNSIKTVLNSPNFLLSAKSRITELLNKGGTNKYKHHEKENSSNKSNPVSCSSAATSSGSLLTVTSCNIQSLSNSINKKRNGNNNIIPASSSDAHIKNACVVLEDVIKNGTDRSNLPSSKSVSVSVSSRKKIFPFDRSKERKTAKATNSSSCDNAESSLHNFRVSRSSRNQNAAKNIKLNGNISKSSADCRAASVSSDVCDVQVINLGDLLIAPKVPVISCSSVRNEPELTTMSVPIMEPEIDDSELVDDPSVLENSLSNDRTASYCKKSSQNESLDPDVVLLCEKEPVAEVITLDDVEEDSEVLIEEVHKCSQCDKAFRAKSLLDFHIKMHGSYTSTSSQLCNSS